MIYNGTKGNLILLPVDINIAFLYFGDLICFVKVKPGLLLILLPFYSSSFAQEVDKEPAIGIYTGMINYEGDLKPNSFTFQHSNYFFSLFFRKPLNRWITWRSGF